MERKAAKRTVQHESSSKSKRDKSTQVMKTSEVNKPNDWLTNGTASDVNGIVISRTAQNGPKGVDSCLAINEGEMVRWLVSANNR